MNRCHVIALLGLSPAVITQLIWHLVHVEDCRVLGLDLWTTESSRTRYTGSQQLDPLHRFWDKLQEALGARADWIPADPTASVTPFTHAGTALADIHTTEQSTAVLTQLQHAVRTRTAELPDHTPLIGGLSGGRKTMSAALMTAFVLHGRPQDRLVHISLNPAMDTHENRPKLRNYAFPTLESERDFGLPMAQQTHAHDVPFPPLPALLRAHGAGLADLLDSDRFTASWQAIRQTHANDVFLHLQSNSRGYDVVLRSEAGTVSTWRIAKRLGDLLHVLIHSAEPLSTTALAAQFAKKRQHTTITTHPTMLRYARDIERELAPVAHLQALPVLRGDDWTIPRPQVWRLL
jgi:CRISPR-associated protein (TIGR02584 family)